MHFFKTRSVVILIVLFLNQSIFSPFFLLYLLTFFFIIERQQGKADLV